ncbi:hypothetical protein [Acidovorax sp. sic0104]|uniref:hypothetical protein n=1 Tax=Acidovorax sp. sic0104 TaxID=2854784 RepID=UPI001C466024|nr:hypothetical protein [Acidovorax sp. sic0104]MBV7542224.1 hypothetical protein [Acidovorax sp. sic0104]
MRIVFEKIGDFEAKRLAYAWCEANGISVGQTSAMDPSGLLFGAYDWIAKWRNLTSVEREALDGQMTGDLRHGPVVVYLKDAAVKLHLPALMNDLPPAAQHVA